MTDYFKKYLKYKNKYLILKNQIGGNFSREQVLKMMTDDFTNFRIRYHQSNRDSSSVDEKLLKKIVKMDSTIEQAKQLSGEKDDELQKFLNRINIDLKSKNLPEVEITDLKNLGISSLYSFANPNGLTLLELFLSKDRLTTLIYELVSLKLKGMEGGSLIGTFGALCVGAFCTMAVQRSRMAAIEKEKAANEKFKKIFDKYYTIIYNQLHTEKINFYKTYNVKLEEKIKKLFEDYEKYFNNYKIRSAFSKRPVLIHLWNEHIFKYNTKIKLGYRLYYYYFNSEKVFPILYKELAEELHEELPEGTKKILEIDFDFISEGDIEYGEYFNKKIKYKMKILEELWTIIKDVPEAMYLKDVSTGRALFHRTFDDYYISFARFLTSKQEELDDIYINYNTAFILACDINDSMNSINNLLPMIPI